MPAGKEGQVKALFNHIAGIPQTWGYVHLDQYDFSAITITRARTSGHNPFVQAEAVYPQKIITIYDFGMQTRMLNAINPQSIGSYTNFRMEFLGAVLLHELLSVYQERAR